MSYTLKTLRHIVPILLAFALLVSFGSASARPLTDIERTSLEARADTFIAAFADNDMSIMFEAMPQTVLEIMADKSGMTQENYTNYVIIQIEMRMPMPIPHDIFMPLDGLDLIDVTRPDDTNIAYGLLPFSYVLDSTSESVRIDGNMLAILENNIWYLVRIASSQQLAMVQQAYPGLSGIDISPSTRTMLTN